MPRRKIYLKAHQVGDLTPVDSSPIPHCQRGREELEASSIREPLILRPFQGPPNPHVKRENEDFYYR